MSFPVREEQLLKMLENEKQAISQLLRRITRVYGLPQTSDGSITPTTGDSTLAQLRSLREGLQEAQAAAEEFLRIQKAS